MVWGMGALGVGLVRKFQGFRKKINRVFGKFYVTTPFGWSSLCLNVGNNNNRKCSPNTGQKREIGINQTVKFVKFGLENGRRKPQKKELKLHETCTTILSTPKQSPINISFPGSCPPFWLTGFIPTHLFNSFPSHLHLPFSPPPPQPQHHQASYYPVKTRHSTPPPSPLYLHFNSYNIHQPLAPPSSLSPLSHLHTNTPTPQHTTTTSTIPTNHLNHPNHGYRRRPPLPNNQTPS